MLWSFSNKASDLPQLLSFQGSQEEKPTASSNSLALAALVTTSTTAEAFDIDHKSYSGIMQKNINPEMKGGDRCTLTTYPTKHLDTHTKHHPLTSPVSPPVSAAIHQAFITRSRQNLICSAIPQFAEVSMARTIPAIPSSSPVVGTTDLRNASKNSGFPSLLTIFYAGSVCAYDNISPKKARAIMLLAGNRPPVTSSSTFPAAAVQASIIGTSVLEGYVANQKYGTTHHCSSAVPIISTKVSYSAGGSGRKNEVTSAKPEGFSVASSIKAEPLKAFNYLESVSAFFLSSGTVPQFRTKSLARFLQKRKERVISTSPYVDKQSRDSSNPATSQICL